MRLLRALLCCLILSGALALPIQGTTHAAANGPGEMTGSVIKRETHGVSAADTDLTMFAADRYIVTYTSDVLDVVATTDKLAKSLGFEPDLIYTARVHGFAAKLTEKQVASIKKRSVVAAVEIDAVIPAPRVYDMPTGVERIGTLANATAKIDGADQRVNVDVAVVDSGADFNNPDLNIASWADCTSTNGTGWDELGHGTHVAGTIGALDDGAGVTGVAPGARIWSIKIFTAQGGLESWAICGLELVADNGAAIDVANMSWGWYESGADGPCSETAIHEAICAAYNAGVTLVNAAGNDHREASNSVPTTYSQVIAVSAIADSDGKIGGKGKSTSYGCDDCMATFSNYGADIDIAAPGVDILSLCPSYLDCNVTGLNLEVMSGTSMASPHVAGAAALYIAHNGRVGPDKVRAALIANSDQGSISGDRDSYHERTLYAGDLKPTCPVEPSAGIPGATASIACTGFRVGETITAYWDASGGTKVASITANSRGNGNASFAIPTSPRGLHSVIAKGKTSRLSATDSLRIQGDMTLSPSAGAAGSSVTLKLTGFGAGETVTVTLDPGKGSQKVLKSNVVTLSNGTKNFSVTVPVGTTIGSHKIEAKGNQGSKTTRTYTVTAKSASISGAEATGTSTPSATVALTEDASPTATAVATETPAPTETATPEPTESPTSEATATATETETPEVTPEPTEEAPAEGTPTS